MSETKDLPSVEPPPTLQEELRDWAVLLSTEYGSLAGVGCSDAADHIDALEAENARLRHENEMLTTGGIIEVAVRNFNVAEYMNHWEKRAEAAEAEVARLKAQILSNTNA